MVNNAIKKIKTENAIVINYYRSKCTEKASINNHIFVQNYLNGTEK